MSIKHAQSSVALILFVALVEIVVGFKVLPLLTLNDRSVIEVVIRDEQARHRVMGWHDEKVREGSRIIIGFGVVQLVLGTIAAVAIARNRATTSQNN